jgi:hypothetical protein
MSRPLNPAPWLILLAALGPSCAGMEAPTSADKAMPYEEGLMEYEMDELADDAYFAGGAPPPASEPMAEQSAPAGPMRRAKAKEAPKDRSEGELDGRMTDAEQGGDDAPTRAWFPESFVFEPLVVTDGDGLASLEVTVPDQLTDWRILALAHDRDGGQAGAEARFASTLPVYLDVAEPPTLRVGDVVKLPLQVVNNQGEAFRGGLSARTEGAAVHGATSGTLGIEGHDSFLEYVDLHADRPGQATLKVDLVATDRVERPVVVVPTGRRLDRAQGGTLAAPREFSITAPYGAQPGSSSLSLVVYPGPLAILAEEMGRSLPGAHLQDAAYGFALAGHGRDIAARLGQEIDEDALRRSRILAYQRLVRFTRSPDLPSAVVALAAARTQPDDELATALASRLVEQVSYGQSPDGSFAAAWSGNSASLPRALAMSAMAAHWAGELAPRVSQRAAGFAARNAGYVSDPYTAALLLASGLVQGPQADRLLEQLLEGVETLPDGTRVVRPGGDAQRLDGRSPGTVECTAWAVLALAGRGDQQELVSDLAAALLGSYRPGRGFGDGLAGLAALEALSVVFDQPLPETVQVRLLVDGQELMTRDMNMAGNYAPLVAQAAAPAMAGPHSYRIEASPAVPGLAFSLTQTAYLPWEGDPDQDGFSLKVSASGPAAVGETLPCRLQAAVPGGEPFTVSLELPAGVEVEQRSLQALVDQGSILAFESREGRLELSAPSLASGAVFDATVELVPTLAGSLNWGGASLALASRPDLRVQAPVGALRVGLR